MKCMKIMSIGNSETVHVQTIFLISQLAQKFDRFGKIYTNSNQFRENVCVCFL